MPARRNGRRRPLKPIAASLAALPLPAFAADAAMQAWGAYLFFAIVATVVIVLLLHEALDDEPTEESRRDDVARSSAGAAPIPGVTRYATKGERRADPRRIA